MSTQHQTKRGAPVAPGEFQARVYLVGGPPDGDGDVVDLGAVEDGHEVRVSLGEHDTVYHGAEPSGTAKLYRVANAVHAFGAPFDSARGRALRAKLLKGDPQTEWSVAWPIASVKARGPTAAELARWPDAKRIILRWNPVEISPVSRGSCGPTCRTLTAKCSGCGGHEQLSVEDLFKRGNALLAKIRRSSPPPARTPTWGELSREVDRIDARMAQIIAETTPVSDGKRLLARQWADAVAAIWGVPSPTVRWGTSSMKAWGEYDRTTPDAIYVSPDVAMKDIGRVVCHEISHLARHRLGFPFQDERGVEADTDYLFARLT